MPTPARGTHTRVLEAEVSERCMLLQACLVLAVFYDKIVVPLRLPAVVLRANVRAACPTVQRPGHVTELAQPWCDRCHRRQRARRRPAAEGPG